MGALSGFKFGFGLSEREQDARRVQTAGHSGYEGHTAAALDEERGKDGWRQHSRAFILAIAAYMGIFLFGYDTGLGGGVIKLPGFIKDYGIEGSATYKANLSANIVSILQAGAFFGALGAAPFSNWLGRKWTIMLGNFIFIVGAVLQTAGTTLSTLYPGRFFAGMGVGLMSSVCPTYVAELAPAHLRGNITGLFQVIVVIGVAFSYWINYGVSFMASSTAQWRIPVGFQLVPVGIMSIIIPFIKESPRWLASKHRNADALKSLAWIRKRSEDSPLVQMELAEIVAAVEEDEAAMAGRSWTAEVRKRGNPARFFIAFVMFVCQQWSGQNSINYYAPTIFNSIGIQGTKAGLLASGVYGLVKIVATAAFILFGIERFGRKKWFAYGGFAMGLLLLLIGAVFHTHIPNAKATSPSGASIGMAVLIYLFVIPYCFSWGPMCWVYCSEIFTTRNRAYGLAVAAGSQWLNNFAITRATPLMVLALDKGGIFFFFGAINMLNVIFSLWIPETRGLTLEQMDVVFGAISAEERNRELEEKAAAWTAQNGRGSDGGSIGGSFETEEKYAKHAEHVEGVALPKQTV